MNLSFIEKWANALPNFKQGNRYLHPTEDEYCCLGVACELYRQETGKGEWELKDTYDESPHYCFVLDDETAITHLPLAVANYIGLRSSGAVEGYEYTFGDRKDKSLIYANDGLNATFDDIQGALLGLVAEKRADGA